MRVSLDATTTEKQTDTQKTQSDSPLFPTRHIAQYSIVPGWTLWSDTSRWTPRSSSGMAGCSVEIRSRGRWFKQYGRGSPSETTETQVTRERTRARARASDTEKRNDDDDDGGGDNRNRALSHKRDDKAVTRLAAFENHVHFTMVSSGRPIDPRVLTHASHLTCLISIGVTGSERGSHCEPLRVTS